MRILDRYILKSIVVIFVGTVFTFAFLFILIDMFGNLQDFIEKAVGINTIMLYYASFLPTIIVQTSTMACLKRLATRLFSRIGFFVRLFSLVCEEYQSSASELP